MTLEDVKKEILFRLNDEYPKYSAEILPDPEDESIFRIRVWDVDDIDFLSLKKFLWNLSDDVEEGIYFVKFVPSIVRKENEWKVKYEELVEYTKQICSEGGTVCETCDDERCPIRKDIKKNG